MALRVNPTRMELSRLKKRLSTATRGHKLLKDKQDEMVRQFMILIRHNKSLREEIEAKLIDIMKQFANVRLKMSYEGIIESLMVPSKDAEITVGSKSIMNIKLPTVSYQDNESIDITYGFAFTPSELDDTVLNLSKLLPKLIELAHVEKSTNMLAQEIEKTRRRVNAIEYVMIPEISESIRYITNKLDENERSNIIRLMKSKEIVLKKG
ncbi:MAG TPA: V-type ATP synthase subunit D [Acholeplasmataceae bacterium]|jgi:V/A-type H+-transporting ATPase subunit D|nr:V-type ATP synthase subunit D [Acholeplasmataceae bacterium]